MKKKLLIAVITLLCLTMTVPSLFSVFHTASQQDGATTKVNADSLSLSPLNASGDTSEQTKEITDFITGDPSNTLDLSKQNPQHVTFSGDYQISYTMKGLAPDTYRTFKAEGEDPYVYLVKDSSIPVRAGRFIVITYRTFDAVDCDLQLYIGSVGDGASGDTMLRQPNVTNTDAEDKTWHTVLFDTATIASAFYNGRGCRYFRLDPLEGATANGCSIDIKKIDFYDAEDIDYSAYQKYLEEEEAKKNRVEWPDPTYQEMETSADDTYAGTLTYTPSEDNSMMTISYMVNGKKVSYTVPNKNNYLFGGFRGTDDIGRELYTANDPRDREKNPIGVVGSNGNRYVGLFYFLWMGQHPVGGDNNGIYDLQKILDEYGADYLNHFGPAYAHHFYAEPLYGYYYSEDEWVMKKHAELLCNAGIDFLYLDATNGNAYLSNAMKLMGVLHDLNEQGYDAPQVVFYTNSSSASVIDQVYNSIYKNGLYQDTWFCIDGKPVIVGTEDRDSRYGRQNNGAIKQEYKDFFYIKESQWPNESQKKDAWPWMDFNWPQRAFVNADGKISAINVSVAQHGTNIAFGTSAFGALTNPNKWGGGNINLGRSFNHRVNSPATRADYHQAWLADPSLTNLGLNFQAQWDRAHSVADSSSLEFVLVTGWNEWVAQYQKGTDALFVDCASMEFSRDTEMMRGGYFDNYYMQLIQNVEKFKGDAPVIVQDARKPINVTGSFDQWDDVLVTYTDPMMDCSDRNAPGFGGQILIDTSGRNDIVASKVIADTQNIYFYVQTRYDIAKYDKTSSWLQLFIDIDNEASTGWYGYDFIVNYRAKNDFTTTVAKYNGANNLYSFVAFEDVNFRAKNNEFMIAVPLDTLGIDNYDEINFQFKWADSETRIDTMEQFYTDGDAAPLGRLNYVFQNYVPADDIVIPDGDEETESESESESESEIESDSETETESESETETESEIETESEPQASETDAEDSDDGCGSIIGTGAAAVLLTAMAAAIALRKKEY